MKKFLLLLCCFVFLAAVAFADSFDLSSLSDDELLELESRIMQEKSSRTLLPSAILTEGEYLVGENADVPPGRYDIILLFSDDIGENNGLQYLRIYIVNEGHEIYDHDIHMTTADSPHPKYSITFTEGQKFYFKEHAAIRLVKLEKPVFE